MSLTQTTTGAINQIMAFDGTAAIKDAIHDTAFTVAGTPTTAAFLGATAPDIGAGKYASCYTAIPFAAGQAFSMMFAVDTAWAGDDGAAHFMLDCYAASDGVRLFKHSNNILYFEIDTTGGGCKQRYMAVDATNWAAGTHIIIATADTANTQQLFLDGVAATGTSGSTGREVSNGPFRVGTDWAWGTPFTGLILCAVWGRVLTSGEITALSSPATWASVIDLPQITVTGLATGNAVRLYDAAGNVHASAVESGGTATLTYTLD